MSGEFTGEVIDQQYFPNEADGIALYACDDGSGCWISTDQGKTSNTFHTFDRQKFEHIRSFSGETTMNTDGIALTQRPRLTGGR
jgi:3-phytase